MNDEYVLVGLSTYVIRLIMVLLSPLLEVLCDELQARLVTPLYGDECAIVSVRHNEVVWWLLHQFFRPFQGLYVGQRICSWCTMHMSPCGSWCEDVGSLQVRRINIKHVLDLPT